MARVSAKRHAQAVFQIALEREELEQWLVDLEIIADRLKDPQLIALLENPKLHFSEKKNFLDTILAGINPLAMNLAYFLLTKNRLGILSDLVIEYQHLLDAYQGREQAEVITAIPLEGEEIERLRERLSEAISKEVVLNIKVDPDIIGGIVARIGDKLIDGSVRTKLEEMRKGLTQAGR